MVLVWLHIDPIHGFFEPVWYSNSIGVIITKKKENKRINQNTMQERNLYRLAYLVSIAIGAINFS